MGSARRLSPKSIYKAGGEVVSRAETERLENELFRIQCLVLDWGTNKDLSAEALRRRLMGLREDIIAFRAKAPTRTEP